MGDEHDVVVAGAGPTGLMLAAELALTGVDVVVVERRPTQDLDGSRAGGLHARTLEVLDQRGVVDRFLAEGQVHPSVGFALVALDIGDFPTRHPYVLALTQVHVERLLAAWVDELGVPVRRSTEVAGFDRSGGDGVAVELSDGSTVRARYLVGCDGGRSLVRKAAGIDFPGVEASTSWMIAEVAMAEPPALGFRRDAAGTHAMNQAAPGAPVRVVLTERRVDHDGPPSLDDLRAALVEVYGTDFGVHGPSWISRFTDVVRQAATYRAGRVLLAGDAAHVHPPQGGQGLNVGVQDAVNLGWKLGLVVRGCVGDELLDTYHAERHPVGAAVLRSTMAMVALAGTDERHQALRETVAELLASDEPPRRVAGQVSGLDIRYAGAGAHPLVGRRMPDLDLELAAGGSPTRVSTLLHPARPLLLRLDGGTAGFDLGPWADRVRLVEARTGGPWALPVIGPVDPVDAALVRPDGHVAWAGTVSDPALPATLTSWFGPPA